MAEDEIPLRKPNKNSILHQPISLLSPLITIFLDSIKIIFIQNPKLFITIYTFTTLPLSLLLTSSSITTTTRYLKSHINRLEWLYHVVPIWIEAANIRDELRADFRKLFKIKLLHGIPIFGFSLAALGIIVISCYGYYKKKKKVSLKLVMGVFKFTWMPPMCTSMFNFIVWVMWGYFGNYLGRFAVEYWWLTVVEVVVEVEVMAVLGVGLVVSVVEGRVGFGAVWVGWGLMKGRRVCGWVLSGLVLVVSGFIGREMVGVMDGGDLGRGDTWTVEMRFGCMIGLVVLLGWFLLWSYVVFAVFYFECRKLHVIRDEEVVLDIDDIDI